MRAKNKGELWDKVVWGLGVERLGQMFEKIINAGDPKTIEILSQAFAKTKLTKHELDVIFNGVKLEKLPKKKSDHKIDNSNYEICEDLVQRDNSNQFHDRDILSTDIFKLDPPKDSHTRNVFLAIVINHRTKEVVGWSFAAKEDLQLVLDAFAMIPDEELEGTIVHSQPRDFYCEPAYQEMLKQHHCLQSMAKNGSLMDNQNTKYFMRCLNVENLPFIDIKHLSMEEYRTEIDGYLDVYNNERIQSNLGWKAPVQYKNELKKNAKK